MSKFAPMLADDADLNNLRWPLLVSPKLDGVRATFIDGQLLTRSLKPVPNKQAQKIIPAGAPPLDMELIVGDSTAPDVFRSTMKVVMSHEALVKDLRCFVFDRVGDEPFVQRLNAAHSYCDATPPIFVPVKHVAARNMEELLDIESKILLYGYEGLMLRDPVGPYKYGRSTAREGWLMKLKRKTTSEYEVRGFVEQMHNANEAKLDNLGYMERSSHQENLVPMGTLGAIEARDIHSGVEFNVGTGFTAAERQEIWNNQAKYIGTIRSYEFLAIGVKDKPRHPVDKGPRDKKDMS